jgi:hypothetical protein
MGAAYFKFTAGFLTAELTWTTCANLHPSLAGYAVNKITRIFMFTSQLLDSQCHDNGENVSILDCFLFSM